MGLLIGSIEVPAPLNRMVIQDLLNRCEFFRGQVDFATCDVLKGPRLAPIIG